MNDALVASPESQHRLSVILMNNHLTEGVAILSVVVQVESIPDR